jgi:hypothetical protein
MSQTQVGRKLNGNARMWISQLLPSTVSREMVGMKEVECGHKLFLFFSRKSFA